MVNEYVSDDLHGDLAYKVHSILEGLGENESQFQSEENLREKVSNFYEDHKNFGSMGYDPRLVELEFESYLENDEIYDAGVRVDAVSKLIDEGSESSLNDSFE